MRESICGYLHFQTDIGSAACRWCGRCFSAGRNLRVNGEAQAFTFGEPSAADTFVVHAEKALLNYQGAYTAVNCEFAKTLADRFAYINREEDTGSEGLRKAKLSYHPAFLEEKYLITFSEV